MDATELIVGSYEATIFGFKISIPGNNGSYTLETSFTDDSHRGALRAMTVSPGGVLASSSTDDSIRLHSLKKRKEIGGLFAHEGTVDSLTFFKGSHMFSASEDGTICMWKCKGWELLRTLKGHKPGVHVMAFAVHPTGKLGLSVGNDRSFYTWDLTTGKLAFKRNIKEVAQNILFTSSGDHYILVYDRKIEVCSMEDTEPVSEIQMEWRINSVCFLREDVLAIGGDDRHILLKEIFSGEDLITLDMAKPGEEAGEPFRSRVRSMCIFSSDNTTYLAAALANGNIKVVTVHLEQKKAKAESVLFYETKTRITCMAVYHKSDELHSNSQVGQEAEEEEMQTVQPQTKRDKSPKKRPKKTEVSEVGNDEVVLNRKQKMNEKRKRKLEESSGDPETKQLKQQAGRKLKGPQKTLRQQPAEGLKRKKHLKDSTQSAQSIQFAQRKKKLKKQ